MLEGQNILILSPQPWGRMFVSKHHYALELCRRGNQVWFLEPPRTSGPISPQTRAVPGAPGLTIVSRRTFIPDVLRLRARKAYDVAVTLEVASLVGWLRTRFDVVWSFDPNLYSDLRPFGGRVRIYHPVDMVASSAQLAPARTADVVFSVAENILDRFRGIEARRHFVNHGLGPAFVEAARDAPPWHPHPGSLRVGYVGNLFIHQLDRGTFQTIVSAHPEIEFHVWGPTAPAESNVGGHRGRDISAFVAFLREAPNVRLRGVATPDDLPALLREMDALLLCYDPKADPASGANSHKILEYLSTGRTVIANHVSTYADRPDLLVMAPPGDNGPLPRLFDETMRQIARHNAPESSAPRVAYALDNAYTRHVDRIDRILEDLPVHRPRSSRAGASQHKEIA